VDFFDDDADAEALPPAPRPRRSSNRRRNRILRLVFIGAILFLVILLLAFWVRSCQQNRKEEAYRDYMSAVATAIDDSEKVGKDLSKIVADPGKYGSGDELKTALDELVARQDEIATRVGRLERPDTLADEADVLTTGMRVRTRGLELFRKAIGAALNAKKSVKPGSITALSGYLSGPDAYYQYLFYGPARRVMRDEDVVGVKVPIADYYLKNDILSAASVTSMLSQLGASAKLGGTHGVALDGVTAKPSGTALVRGKSVPIPASPDLSFEVTVENQGSSAEADVVVEVVLVLPGGDKLKQTATIAAIAAGKKTSIEVEGFVIPNTAISRVSTLRVKAGPVPEEQTTSNNSATYQFLLQLQ
jgi:hypothetical protein